jgi:hypothetical protein
MTNVQFNAPLLCPYRRLHEISSQAIHIELDESMPPLRNLAMPLRGMT